MDPTKKKKVKMTLTYKLESENVGDWPEDFYEKLFDDYVAYVKDELPFLLEISETGELWLCIDTPDGYKRLEPSFDPLYEVECYNFFCCDDDNFVPTEILENRFIAGYKNLIKRTEKALAKLQVEMGKRKEGE